MCALFGWLDYKGLVTSRTLQKLTQALANAAEERGTDATGIAYIRNHALTIYKRPRPAHKLKFRIPVKTTAVMGHTRFTTQGSEKKNYNNHPFRGFAGKEFAFAHNGIIYNDRDLRKTKKLPMTKIETDSYIAVQLLEQAKTLNFSSLANMAEEVSGNFTFTLLDQDNTLYFVKGSSPLYLIHFPQFGLYVYASTQSIMEKALKTCNLTKYRYDVISIKNGDILMIDKFGNETKSTFRSALSNSFNYMYSYEPAVEDNFNESLDTLILMCHYFGITKEDVLDLVDQGYTYDEIEEILAKYM